LANSIWNFVKYLVLIVLVAGAIVLLNLPTQVIIEQVALWLPVIVSTVLLLGLGILIVKLVMSFISSALSTVKVEEYFEDFGLGSEAVETILLIIRALLYLFVFYLTLLYLDLPAELLGNVLGIIALSALVLIVGLFFFGMKDVAANWIAASHLKSKKLFKMGQRISFDDIEGEVIDISNSCVAIDSGEGFTVYVPNSEFIKKKVKVQKFSLDLKRFETFRKHFAVRDIEKLPVTITNAIASVYGFRNLSKKLKKLNTDLDKLIPTLSSLTSGALSGSEVPLAIGANLIDEMKAWLIDDAIITLIVSEPKLFPGTKKRREKPMMCVAVEGDRLLLVDFDQNQGSVYLLHHKDVENAIQKKYFVVANKGSRAFFRLKNKLHYANPKHYRGLSKPNERKVKQIYRELSLSDTAIAPRFDQYLQKLVEATKFKIEKLWKSLPW